MRQGTNNIFIEDDGFQRLVNAHLSLYLASAQRAARLGVPQPIILFQLAPTSQAGQGCCQSKTLAQGNMGPRICNEKQDFVLDVSFLETRHRKRGLFMRLKMFARRCETGGAPKPANAELEGSRIVYYIT
jgi:hypothetical protein